MATTKQASCPTCQQVCQSGSTSFWGKLVNMQGDRKRSPLHLRGTLRVGETLAVSLFPPEGWRPVKVHDMRGRVKRDVVLREHHVSLMLYKQRFRCTRCR